MGRRWNQEEAKRLFKRLRQEYDVYAPRLFEGTGCFSDTDVVRYGTVDSFEEIVWDKKSDYSFKGSSFANIRDHHVFYGEQHQHSGGAQEEADFFKELRAKCIGASG